MSKRSRSEIPVVFISSTSEDLKPYREAARDAALKATFHPDMMESFTVSGARPPLAECQAKAAEADVTVVIVAHRYGWVPVDQAEGDHKNITWLECEAAIAAGQELLAFVLDDNYLWPNELREEQQLITAVREGRATPDLLATVQKSVARLRDLKSWLNSRGIRGLFTTPEDLRGKISDALREWRSRQSTVDRPGLTQLSQRLDEEEGFELQQLIVDEHACNFVGRGLIQRSFDRFLAENPRGYFIVWAEPGQGKTALACHLVKSRGLPHHFIRRGTGRTDARLILSSLIIQLAHRSKVELSVPESLPERVRRLENLIVQAVSIDKPLVLTIDALDELPDDTDRDLPFLVTEGLPKGAFYFVTCRPGERYDNLVALLKQFSVPFEIHRLEALDGDEARRLLHAKRPDITNRELDQIAAAAEGSPLYLTSIVEAIERDPGFDLDRLPPAVEGIFASSLEIMNQDDGSLARQVLGLLTVARKPLSLGDLCEITGQRQRQVDERAVKPIRQFLHEWKTGFSFYHSRFRDFLLKEILYEDEVADCHRLIADWLCGPMGRSRDYRWTSLAFHLFNAGERSRLTSTIDTTFLRQKLDRHGYDVLEDIEFVSRVMLDVDDPEMVTRCATMVEELREWIGGDLVQETHRTILGLGTSAEAGRNFIPQPAPALPGIDVFAAVMPKLGVGADFIELIPIGERLIIAIGDAPGVGLRGAFVARFVANLVRRLVCDERDRTLLQILQEIDRRISSHEMFTHVAMQCVEVDPMKGTVTIANAGMPHPVMYSARRRKCDRLMVRGTNLHDGQPEATWTPYFEQRHAEFDSGDVLALCSDGLTEGHRLDEGRYGYRFMPVVEQTKPRTARDIGEAVLVNWSAHPRDSTYYDDVSVVIITSSCESTAVAPPSE